jgi:glycosyltransferase involved in cell wall biosynthesis
MKVAFFQPYLANWRIEFLERFIAESPHQIIVYDGGFSPKKDTKSISGNQTAFPVQRLRSWSPEFVFRGQKYPFYFSPFLFFSLLKNRPDCVITEGEINFINNISVLVYCLIFRKKYIWWSLGKVRTRKKNIVNRILDPVVDSLLRRAACIMARNSYAKSYYQDEKRISGSKIIVAPNSMDEVRAYADLSAKRDELLAAKNGEKSIIYVGALTAEKRPADLLEAFRFIVDQGRTDVQLWFVGDGPERQHLEKMVASLNLGNRVKFWGKIFKGVGDYFAAADVVAVPGLGGLVINHAMIFSKPVVSRLADGTELDLIQQGVNGYVLDDYDNEALAGALLKVIDSPHYESMCSASREIVDQSWNMRLMIARVHECIALATTK